MRWQDDLARKIAASRECHWDCPPVATGGVTDVGQQSFTVPVGAVPADIAGALEGRVNAEPVAGAGAGELLVTGFDPDGRGGSLMTVALREIPWNQALRPDGTLDTPVRADGRPMYETADLAMVA